MSSSESEIDSVQAQHYYDLSNQFRFGRDIQHDPKKVLEYLELSCKGANRDAQYALGFLYEIGQYVSADIDRALHFYELSATQQNLDAIYALGRLHSAGTLVERDLAKAAQYFLVGSQLGSEECLISSGDL